MIHHVGIEILPADVELGIRRARAATLLMLALPGTAYLYQGEELGLPEVEDLPEDVLADPTWFRTEHQHRGRDGCRVPIPWTTEGSALGFGPDGSTPWLPQPDYFAELSVELAAATAALWAVLLIRGRRPPPSWRGRRQRSPRALRQYRHRRSAWDAVSRKCWSLFRWASRQ